MGKISDEDFKKIGTFKQQSMELVYNLGELQYQKISIDLLIEELKAKIKENRVKEAQLLSDLKTKYGNVSINIETGEF